ncbi:MAG: nuclear transport factor 2 family protein [Arenicella sp.]|nr:nuclear transport factor 2 family protein [Arenicella sp.]
MESNIESVVQSNLDAYNQRDIDGFMASISGEIELYGYGNPEPSLAGAAAVRDFYLQLFENSPGLKSTILSRIVIGNKVIDHESITGRNGSDELVELVLIYEVENQQIVRITVIRPGHN